MAQLTEFAYVRIPEYTAKDLMAFLDGQGIHDSYKDEVDELRYMIMMDKIISKGIDAVKESE